jgi:multidrug efflux pump subunit AcrA (membrane-fusion protein)
LAVVFALASAGVPTTLFERISIMFWPTRGSWLLALCAVATGCGQSGATAPIIRPPAVTVSRPSEIEVVDNYYYEGYTEAVSSVDIRARVTGYLSKIYFQDGSDVKEGDPLFLIDPRPYQAELEQAKAQLARVEATHKRLQADYARAEKLLPNRTITKEEFDRIAAELAEAAADMRAKQASITQADLNLHFAAIKAPITGRIGRHLVPEGNLVAANETLLTTIVTVKPIYAYFDVEGYPYAGTINFVDNRVDQGTGTLKIRAVFPNENEALSPGLHAKIRMPLGKPYKALAVPERAIGTRQGMKYVFVVNNKNVVVERPVTLGLLQDRMRVITKGVEPGDRVIVTGIQRVRAEVTVEPREAESTAQQPAGSATPVASAR